MNTDHKLIETKKKFVFGNLDEKNYRLSPKTSLIYRLYQKKVNEKNYFSITAQWNEESKTETELLAKKLSYFFIISAHIHVMHFLLYFSSFSEGKEFTYLNDHNYFETISQFYLRKSLNKEIKNKVHWR